MNNNAANADSICPLCNSQNKCAISLGTDPNDCWCQNTQIDSDTLAKIPPEYAGKVCICAQCALKGAINLE